MRRLRSFVLTKDVHYCIHTAVRKLKTIFLIDQIHQYLHFPYFNPLAASVGVAHSAESFSNMLSSQLERDLNRLDTITLFEKVACYYSEVFDFEMVM